MFLQGWGAKGTYVIRSKNDLPKDNEEYIVQHYIDSPHLINGRKYHIRAFALVTSVNPFRLYIYHDGLTRFTSKDYSIKDIDDPLIHMTNNGVNKKVPDPRNEWARDWTHFQLREQLEKEGVPWEPIWNKMKDIMTKIQIMSEPYYRLSLTETHYNQYQWMSTDFMLDANYKLWLLEHDVNAGLSVSTPNVAKVKCGATYEQLNLARYHLPEKLPKSLQQKLKNMLHLDSTKSYQLTYNPKLYVDNLTYHDMEKHDKVLQSQDYDNIILENLTPSEVRTLIRSEDEKAIAENYQLLFPTDSSSKYLKYFKDIHYTNLLLDAWERRYSGKHEEGIERLRKLCSKNFHND